MTQHHKACQLIALIIYMIWSHHLVICQFSGRNENTPPKFLSESGSSEIVVRVFEGSSALGKEIYHLVGEDQDGDPLKFGVLGSIGEELLKIENSPPNEASVFLKKGKPSDFLLQKWNSIQIFKIQLSFFLFIIM